MDLWRTRMNNVRKIRRNTKLTATQKLKMEFQLDIKLLNARINVMQFACDGTEDFEKNINFDEEIRLTSELINTIKNDLANL